MTIRDWLKKPVRTYTCSDGSYEIQENRPRLYCNDGYSISVQASSFHYCKPRLNGIRDYESVELGFPSTEDELINEYAENDSIYTQTVYGYVPIEIIEKLINKHGGIKA
jgi:hypothetical protein